ncbi:MAG: hypothetical protein KAH22_09105, partial [Thiotrichaceae bacterium]|nr:hypothetical protein [Thiotrichaceae bacterium]
ISINEVLPNKEVQLQKIEFSEYNDFKMPTVSPFKIINENQQRQIGFHFQENEEKLLVSAWSVSGNVRKLTELAPNSWLRTLCNERTISLESTTSYYRLVHNIFYGSASKAGELFRSKKPTMIDDLERIIR